MGYYLSIGEQEGTGQVLFFSLALMRKYLLCRELFVFEFIKIIINEKRRPLIINDLTLMSFIKLL